MRDAGRDEGRGMRDEEETVASHPSSLVPRPSSLIPHPSSLPVVVHFAERFVVMTQNWIYHQVIHTSRYRPVVATQFRENAELFPFDPVLFPESGVQAFRRSGVQEQPASGPERLNARAPERLIHRLAVPLQTISRAYERPVRAVRPALLHAHFGTQAVHLLRLRRRLGVPLV